MVWLFDGGAPSGWAGYLLAAVTLAVFWGAVIVALAALLGTTGLRRRRDLSAPRAGSPMRRRR